MLKINRDISWISWACCSIGGATSFWEGEENRWSSPTWDLSENARAFTPYPVPENVCNNWFVMVVSHFRPYIVAYMLHKTKKIFWYETEIIWNKLKEMLYCWKETLGYCKNRCYKISDRWPLYYRFSILLADENKSFRGVSWVKFTTTVDILLVGHLLIILRFNWQPRVQLSAMIWTGFLWV